MKGQRMRLPELAVSYVHCPVKAHNAGLFVSSGNDARHPTRIINSHELILVRQGRLEMWEEEHTFTLEEGHTLHLWPGRRHGGIGTLPRGLEFYWIHFEVEKCDQSTAIFNLPQVRRLPRPDKLESLFRIFLDGQEAGDLEPCSANLIALLMLFEVAQSNQSRPDVSDRTNVLAERAKNYIHLHYFNNITPGHIAEALGYNPDYLGRVFYAVYHCTLTEAIHRRRVKKACDYLRDSDMTIEEVATACGFNDAGYFRRIFRRYQHITPIHYRNTNARVHINTH
ncbi:MAG: AraC family transcriptional regulator [Anaerolineae bacterium]|nr:AraC family transcriptional regulator [Anaerolineae bacterium]